MSPSPSATDSFESRSKPSILVVDDHPADIEVIEGALSSDYRVSSANSGADALAWLRGHALPDLILLDVVMPGLDGYETCEEIKRDASLADIPVIFVSVKDATPDEQRGFAAGAVDYIGKPIQPSLLRARVGAHVALYRSHLDLDRKVAERTEELEDARLQLRQMAADMALAEERERRRLAVHLHDGPTQELVAAKLLLGGPGGPGGPSGRLRADPMAAMAQATDLIDSAIDQCRNLCFELSPRLLYDKGLEPALEWLGRKHATETGSEVQFKHLGDPRPASLELKVTIYQCARELLQNVAKHARATQVELRLEWKAQGLKLKVSDNGVGFGAAGTEREFGLDGPSQEAGTPRGFGLFSIQDRIDLVGGTVNVHSNDSTAVSVEVPLMS
ncbi:Oxygen sensor histidine kinase NreB [Planctomycetes bacterium Poly30]|uniref:Oxygen sensor histidine kinase NreB n=1 Tax=Saltatorellus ferox TaxID=2528018 RepID=A0A518EWI8_9BACT|nr:Oxygen sensor histidine kinase NreB [Planctomycetes bacterium Poly30]